MQKNANTPFGCCIYCFAVVQLHAMELNDQMSNLLRAARKRRDKARQILERAQREFEESQREVDAVELTQSLLRRGSSKQASAAEIHQPETRGVSFEDAARHSLLGFVTTNIERGPTPEQEANGASHDEAAGQHLMWEHIRADVNRPTTPSFSLGGEVRKAIKELEGQTFVQKDITERLREKHHDAKVYPGSVSAALARMAEQGDLVVVKPAGGGSDPTIYQEVRVSP